LERTGPKGRTANASTDATMRAEVLSYSRARGLFAGISLEGSTVRPDDDANERVYGGNVSAEAIIIQGCRRRPPCRSETHSFSQSEIAKEHFRPQLLERVIPVGT
jgi:lipid-binding SYLF domain-containing protein